MKVTILKHLGYGSICGHAYEAIADDARYLDVDGIKVRMQEGTMRIIYDEDYIPSRMLPLEVNQKDAWWSKDARDYYFECAVCNTRFNIHTVLGAKESCPFCGIEQEVI